MIVTNYTGEVVEFSGTREEALDRGLNVNCSHCSDCSHCSNCSRCSDCYGLYDCYDCYGCEVQPVCIVTDRWSICIRENGTMKIGCQDHSVLEWMEFTDEVIDAMSDHASEFWKKWKPVIQLITKKEAEE